MNRIISLLLFTCIVMGCSGQRGDDRWTSGFDISMDSETILYGLYVNGKTSLRLRNIKNNSDKIIFRSESDLIHINPRFSIDEKQFIFIEYNRRGGNESSSLCIASSDGSNKRTLIEGKGIIFDAIFSRYSDNIFFLLANEYDNYSPIAKKAPHGFNVFSFDLRSKEIKKISDFNAYGLAHIHELDSINFMMTLQAGPDGGMILFNKSFPKKYTRFEPLNKPRKVYLYSSPIYSEEYNKMAFQAPYEVYIMDVKNKIAKSLYHGKQVDHIGFLKGQEKIVFTLENDANFYIINFDGSGLQILPEPPLPHN